MNHYLSIRLLGGAGHGPQHLVPKLTAILHSFMANQDESIALALPRAKEGETPKLGNIVQFFSDHQAALEALADQIEAKPELKDLIAVERIKPVPGDVKRWAAYTRHRLPSRNRGRKDHDEFYAKKMRRRAEKAAEIKTLPVIYMSPNSNNGGRFGLGVKVKTTDAQPDVQGVLNGYGLSSSTQPVWVPEV